MLKLLKDDVFEPNLFDNGLRGFMQEVVDMVSAYLDDVEEVRLFELFIFLADLFGKIGDIVRKMPEYCYVEQLVYRNISNVIGEKGLSMFVTLWEVLLKNKIEMKIISKFETLGKYFLFIFNTHFEACFKKFCTTVYDVLINMKSDDLVCYLNNIISIYPQMSYFIQTFFGGYRLLNKEKIFLSSLFTTDIAYDDTKSTEKLINLIQSDGVILYNEMVTQMLKILLVSTKNFDNFISILFKAFKIILKNNINNPNGLFCSVSLMTSYYLSDKFIMTYIKDEKANFIKYEFKQLVNQTLSNIGKAKSLSLAVHEAILKDKGLLTVIYDYIDILDDIASFEEYYTRTLLERALTDTFDLKEEKDIIDTIVNLLKDRFIHSYKLQTTINSIKRAQKGFMNIVGIPSHCYQILNIGCQPKLEINFQALFDDNKLTLPTNSRLIYQQGYLEVIMKKKYEMLITPLQYSLILVINKNKGIKLERLIDEYGFTEQLIKFLLDGLLKEKLIILEEDKLSINSMFRGPLTTDFRCDLYSFVENKNDNKVTAKHYYNIIDCYIIKFLKKVKQAELSHIQNELKIIQSFVSILNDQIIVYRVNYLVTKELIKHIGNDIYSYN
jgi:hypothetical protein